MEKFLKGYFYNPTLGKISLNRMVEELINYMKKSPDKEYNIIVGCDSCSGEEPKFPVAVVILRKSEGGRFFLKKIDYSASKQKKFYNWRQRILEEVLLSCELALFLREKIAEKVKNISDFSFNYQFRYIHADIGENGQTRDMIKEVIGLIQGNGFEAKIKPESYVASVIADRYT